MERAVTVLWPNCGKEGALAGTERNSQAAHFARIGDILAVAKLKACEYDGNRRVVGHVNALVNPVVRGLGLTRN